MQIHIYLLEFGCALYLGQIEKMQEKDENAVVFKFEGYFGVDLRDPRESYIYVRSYGADLTIKNFALAFDLNLGKLPPAVEESGFVGELLVSWSAKEGGKTNTFILSWFIFFYEYFTSHLCASQISLAQSPWLPRGLKKNECDKKGWSTEKTVIKVIN